MRLRITIDGNSYDVDVEVLDGGEAPPAPRQPAPMTQKPPAAVPPTPPAPAAPAAPAPRAPSASGGGNAVKAPIAGNVTQVKVAVGDTVATNQVVLVMEAMKMETNISSPAAGRVASVACKPGDSVKPGQVLIELE